MGIYFLREGIGLQDEKTETVSEEQMVAFKLEREEFAVSIHQVREVLKMTPVTPLPQSAQFIEGVINLRGEIIPVVDLRKRFEMPAGERNEQTRIIIVEIEDSDVGYCRFRDRSVEASFKGDEAPSQEGCGHAYGHDQGRRQDRRPPADHS